MLLYDHRDVVVVVVVVVVHTQTTGTFRAREPRTATSTLTQFLSSEFDADQCRHTNK